MEDIILPYISFTTHTEPNTLQVVHFRFDTPEAEGLLIGRAAAEDARARFEREMRKVDDADAVAINFEGVRAMTVSFAEGFFVPLLGQWLTGYHEDHPLVVVGANDEVVETLQAVLRLRHLAVVAIEPTGERGASLLGAQEGLGETVELAYRLHDGFGAADIARELNISLQAANNRLKELVRRGALKREAGFAASGGRQYTYRVPRPDGEGGQPRLEIGR